MNEQQKQVYEAPMVGVHETKIKAVICQSNEQINRDNLDW